MNDIRWQTEQFEHHRAHLEAVAYRMLGSVSEAEDAVQEAWLRLGRSRQQEIHNVRGWLTTIVSRVCIDMLRARRSRREDYVGAWLPEPIVETNEQADPERQTLLADSVGLAVLVVLETLSPNERLAFVLHDMFALPFEEIAPIIDRSPQATRQLASRARRRVRVGAPQPDADLDKQREVIEAFLAAARAGDFERLLSVLHPDVVVRLGDGRQLRQQITGAAEVARVAASEGPRFAKLCELAIVNGHPGLAVDTPDGRRGAAGFTVSHGRILTIDLISGPHERRGIDRDADTPADAPGSAVAHEPPAGAASSDREPRAGG